MKDEGKTRDASDSSFIFHPSSLSSLLAKRARAYEALKKWDAAAADWSQAANGNPEGPKLLTEFARRLAAAGEVPLAIGQFEKCQALYERLLQVDPECDPVATELALLFLDKQSVSGDLAALERARTRVRALFAETLAPLAKASAANPNSTELSLMVGALEAWFGQEKELAATRQRILAFAKGTSDVVTAERAAKVCSILPSTNKEEHEAALVFARKAVGIGKDGEWNLLALGMAEYRLGNDTAADETLRAAAKARPRNRWVAGISSFFRAMSLFRLGKKDEAHKVAIEAAAKMKPLPSDEYNPLAGNANIDDLILWLAYKEAKALIKFDEDPVPKGKDGKK